MTHTKRHTHSPEAPAQTTYFTASADQDKKKRAGTCAYELRELSGKQHTFSCRTSKTLFVWLHTRSIRPPTSSFPRQRPKFGHNPTGGRLCFSNDLTVPFYSFSCAHVFAHTWPVHFRRILTDARILGIPTEAMPEIRAQMDQVEKYHVVLVYLFSIGKWC